jgi:hypothetical protein
MLQRIAFLGAVCFWLASAGAGYCQTATAPAESHRVNFDIANEIQTHGPAVSGQASSGQSASGSQPLPDAPSAGLSAQRSEFQETGDRAPQARLNVRPVALYPGSARKTDTSPLVVGLPHGASVFDEAADERVSAQKEPSFVLSKYLYRSTQQKLPRQESTSDSMIGRAADAASRILIPRDATGKRKLNTPYLTRVLAMVVVHAAARPYWERTHSEPFSDFASTVGNDTGMNVLHEFEPGLKQILASHTPRFVSGIEERLLHSASSHH